MKIIKFRARNANLPSCWIYGYFFIEDGNCFIINEDGKFSVIAGTESQFTNIYDKNNKEIYNGDIVLGRDFCDATYYSKNYLRDYISCVEWKFDCWYVGYGNFRNWALGQLTELNSKGIVVIGNLLENPELIDTYMEVF